MMLTSYINQAIRTESRDWDSIQFRLKNRMLLRLAHSALGLANEIGELQEAFSVIERRRIEGGKISRGDWVPIQEEVGDLWWYTAIGFNVLGIKTQIYPGNYSGLSYQLLADIVWVIGDIAGEIKAAVYYGREINLKPGGSLATSYIHLAKLLSELSLIVGSDWRKITEQNIRKLRQRYPRKFSEADANDRDLEAEDKALRGE